MIKRFVTLYASLLLAAAGTAALVACAGQNPLDLVSGANVNYSGYLAVTTVATDPATGPGLVALFSPQGQFVRVVHDYFSTSEFPTGSAFVPPDKLIVGVDGSDRMDLWNLTTTALQFPVTNANLLSNTTPLRQVARDPVDGSVYIVESNPNTIEKFTVNADGSYSRAGNPFIPTTVGSCVLSSPWGLTVIPSSQRVVVLSSAGRLSTYDKDGNCLQHLTAAPLNAGTPVGVAYHSPSNKLIVAFAATHALWSMDQDGSNAAQIFLNASIISTPRGIAADRDGYLYVTSSGTDTVEKLYYSGSGAATRALPGPLLGPSINTQNPTSITVIP